MKNSVDKFSFLNLFQNIDWYSLEPPLRGSSNEYLQSLFWKRNRKIHVGIPFYTTFYYLKVGFKGVCISWIHYPGPIIYRAIQFDGVVLSTDDYFTKGDLYEYDPDKLTEAHQWNRERGSYYAELIDFNPTTGHLEI